MSSICIIGLAHVISLSWLARGLLQCFSQCCEVPKRCGLSIYNTTIQKINYLTDDDRHGDNCQIAMKIKGNNSVLPYQITKYGCFAVLTTGWCVAVLFRTDLISISVNARMFWWAKWQMWLRNIHHALIGNCAHYKFNM